MVTPRSRAAALRLVIVALSMIVATAPARTADARAGRHPLHTTLAEVRYDQRESVVRVTVRLFAPDLAGALRRRGTATTSDTPAGAAATLAYFGDTFVLSNREGPLRLRLESMRRTGDLLWVTVTAVSSTGLRGLTLHNALLMDLFADQVNIVQTTDGDTRRSLLFTHGRGTKAL